MLSGIASLCSYTHRNLTTYIPPGLQSSVACAESSSMHKLQNINQLEKLEQLLSEEFILKSTNILAVEQAIAKSEVL